MDTVYQKGKSLAENKLKQHRQQVKTRQNQNADTPHTPQNDNVSEVQNTPKQLDNAPKVQSKSTAQVKAKEAYIKSQKLQKPENTADTVKTKQNYINAHQNAEIKQKPSVLTPKTRKNTSYSFLCFTQNQRTGGECRKGM